MSAQKIAIFDNFGEVVAPNPKQSLCGKFNCKTRETCEKMCIESVKPQNYISFCTDCTKMGIFRVVVTIATADTHKLELRGCEKFKCASFEARKKCAQNV